VRIERVDPRVKKVDLVVTSVRYDGEGRLTQARGFERQGSVWSDIELFTRDDLVFRVQEGKRVVIGEPRTLPGDFTIRQPVRVESEGWLRAQDVSGRRDDLSLPTY
jgi:hypothetical protein